MPHQGGGVGQWIRRCTDAPGPQEGCSVCIKAPSPLGGAKLPEFQLLWSSLYFASLTDSNWKGYAKYRGFFIQQDLLYICQLNSAGIGLQPEYKNRVQRYPETRTLCRMSLQFVFPVKPLGFLIPKPYWTHVFVNIFLADPYRGGEKRYLQTKTSINILTKQHSVKS